jgi:hypothetical protein
MYVVYDVDILFARLDVVRGVKVGNFRVPSSAEDAGVRS